MQERNKIFSELYIIKKFEFRVVTFILNQTIVKKKLLSYLTYRFSRLQAWNKDCCKYIFHINSNSSSYNIFCYWSSTSMAKLKDCVGVLNLGRLWILSRFRHGRLYLAISRSSTLRYAFKEARTFLGWTWSERFTTIF